MQLSLKTPQECLLHFYLDLLFKFFNATPATPIIILLCNSILSFPFYDFFRTNSGDYPDKGI